MRTRPAIRPLIVGAVLFVSGLTVGAAVAGWASAPAHTAIREGTALASFLPEAVMSLTYATPAGTTTAQRSAPGGPFHILSTFADGRPVQRCIASPDMEGRLDKLTTLRARRGLSVQQRETEFPLQLGVVEVRDTIIGEPSGPVLMFTNKNKTGVAVIFDGAAAEVTLQPVAIDWLATACARGK